MNDPIDVAYAMLGFISGLGVLALIGGLWIERWATKPIPEDHPAKR